MLNIHLPYEPAIELLRIYPRLIKSYVHTNNYTQILVVALFVIAPNWNQPKYPPASE